MISATTERTDESRSSRRRHAWVEPSMDAEVPPTRPSAPPPLADAGPVDTTAEDRELRERLIRQLEQEVVVLRRELLRRNRTIGDLGARLAAYETEAESPRPARRPARLVDPRAE